MEVTCRQPEVNFIRRTTFYSQDVVFPRVRLYRDVVILRLWCHHPVIAGSQHV